MRGLAVRRGPLLAVAAACTLFVGVVWLLAVQVPEAGWIDVDVALALEGLRTPALDATARVLAVVGDTAAMTVVTLAAAAAFASARRFREAAYVALTMGAGFAASTVVKALVDRARPAGIALGPVPDGASFPSGHVVAAACLAGALAVVVTMWGGSTPRRRAVAFFTAAAWVVLMAASRVYLGVHFVSDVVAGALLGVAVVAVSTALFFGGSCPGAGEGASPLTPPEA
ncbi:MAG: phosphatase PAP2 family protein [Anaerosomatales bacterium]|nr:phosphatase PAP2 family protein [Anaerosomatales bacterium]